MGRVTFWTSSLQIFLVLLLVMLVAQRGIWEWETGPPDGSSEMNYSNQNKCIKFISILIILCSMNTFRGFNEICQLFPYA